MIATLHAAERTASPTLHSDLVTRQLASGGQCLAPAGRATARPSVFGRARAALLLDCATAVALEGANGGRRAQDSTYVGGLAAALSGAAGRGAGRRRAAHPAEPPLFPTSAGRLRH